MAAAATAAGGDDGRTEEADGAFHPLPSSSSSSSRLAQTNNRCQFVSEQRVMVEQWLLSVSSGSSGSTHFTVFVWRKAMSLLSCVLVWPCFSSSDLDGPSLGAGQKNLNLAKTGLTELLTWDR